ncbi:hypothetical protein L484_010465 [Morus notabilis]|uniref:Aminotransferase-like plant mobile domain-containing protein n=1 Tax=Morus notabilis TaxID=981085 RepID=W9QLZ2_9ROSA|nr:hypothetical protein L484_010465 [Morus notabilis]
MEVKWVDPSGTNPGLIDGSVLNDQEKHVSAAVWDRQARSILKCHEHTSKLSDWTLTPRQVELVKKAGFGFLRLIPAIRLDRALISALVERWRRETNTFHFSVGEMTITLKDVALILRLAIDGEPVTGTFYTTSHSVCEKYLGVAPEPGYTNGGMCPVDAPPEVIERYTRAYLLYLVGCTIFSTTTGNKVPVMYLTLFENFDQCRKYAWGAAALASLYRSLGNASLSSQSSISGCLTLLQGKLSDPTANHDVLFYRKALDSLKPEDVDWLPYRSMDNAIPIQIKSNLMVGRSKTMLICFDKAERHLPNRCLRQYGMLQSIPEDVQDWKRKNRGVDLSGKMQIEINEWSRRRFCIVQGDVGADEGDYMKWYLKITRKFVERPLRLSVEFQRAIAGLREITLIADSFSTEGLDPQQVELVRRVGCIAHECLREQVGDPAILDFCPQVDVGKGIRGKEMVIRKSTESLLWKDEVMPLPYNVASNDEQEELQDEVQVETYSKCNIEQDDTQNLQDEQEDIQNLPFVKSSPICQIIESMDVQSTSADSPFSSVGKVRGDET